MAAERDGATAPPASVFVVTESTWDHLLVLSVWAKRADAEEEARRLRAEDRSYQYDVEEFELYG